MKITLSKNNFNPNPYYTLPIDLDESIDLKSTIDTFDQNGFDLTDLEILYAKKMDLDIKKVRHTHFVLKDEWFTAEPTDRGCHINHAVIFERKGFADAAKEQMIELADKCPLLHKVLQIKPKWGLDFSVDYADAQGNVFEVLHWEWDTFDFEEIQQKKKQMDIFLLSQDWNKMAKQLLDCKEEWYKLGFFEQSDYKTKFFGIEKERFKMVIWK
tara:strand:- start:1451 stop:2089 length:639 start_codon:yes stop_codon:yes gene_type:complete